MESKLKAGLLLLCTLLLTACLDLTTDDDKENADACASGDEAACEQLDDDLDLATAACNSGDTQSCARAVALQALIASIPTGLVVASSTSVTGAGNSSEFADKQDSIEAFLNDTSLTGTELAACFDALPVKPQVQSPLCYGPALDYVDHPDGSGGDGQLPTGDLGLWVADEPGTDTACAAAKLNELVAKAAYNVDLAVGSMTMMACAAAMLGKELPDSAGEKLDLGSALASVTSASLKVSAAQIELASLTNGHTAYKTHLKAKDNQNNPIELSVTHDAEDNSGVLLIKTKENNDTRGTSVVYSIADASLQYKMVSARAQAGQMNGQSQPAHAKTSNGSDELDIDTSSSGEVSLHAGEDVHVMIANMSPTTGDGSLAYAWKAGGNDSHFRALNVVTSTTTGRAYYGYVPKPATSSETINLDLAHDDAGMICNWAGPGNQHQPIDKVQYQALSLSNGEWTASTSNIKYAPTNSCDAAAFITFTPSFAGPNVSNPPALTTEQQEVVDNGTIDGSSAFSNELYDKASINFTMPTAPTAPQ